MIGKILLGTKGKPCSCPTGKQCTACKKKKHIRAKPHVTVEGTNHLPVPIKITTFKESKPTTVQVLQKRKHWNPYQKQAPTESANRGTKICQWYRRRKAYSELKKLTKQEQKRLDDLRIEKARREREVEILEHLKQREKEIRQAEEKLELEPRKKEVLDAYRSKSPIKYKKAYRSKSPVKYEKVNKKKKNKNIKAIEAKPVSESRYASVKTRHPKDSFNERFVNFCYRICCQFYCCVTIILIIGFIIIFAF